MIATAVERIKQSFLIEKHEYGELELIDFIEGADMFFNRV